MTRRPQTRAVSGDAGLLAARNQAPAPAGASEAAAPSQPERAPVRCPTCGHVTIPALVCECGHIEEVHNLAGDNRTRTACSHHEGARNTPCPCKSFIDPGDTETSQ